jgi:uncharacterized membrane protein YqjE
VIASTLSRLLPLVLRHLDAYGEIAGDDTREALARVVAGLVLASAALAFGVIALLMACAWLIVVAWEEPWRAWVPAALAGLFAALAAGCYVSIGHRRSAAPDLFPRLRREWRRDRQLVERALHSQPADRSVS